MSELSSLVTDHDTDILLLTETWLKEHGNEAQKAQMTPAGYALKSFPRKARLGGDLAFLMKKSLEKHVVAKLLSFSTFKVFKAPINYYVQQYFTHFGFFVPPSSQQTEHETNKMFLDPFPDFLHSLSDSKGKIMVVDDFNFYFENEHDSEVCKLRSLLNNCCLKQLVNQPTHCCGHT